MFHMMMHFLAAVHACLNGFHFSSRFERVGHATAKPFPACWLSWTFLQLRSEMRTGKDL